MAKHRAPRYVRTKKALAKAPVAAGATVVGLGVLSSSPAEANDGTARAVVEAPLTPAPAAEAATAAPTTAAPADTSYTVQRGDTMAEIAGTLDQPWRELYQRNVGVIGSNPDLILPGQVLLVAGDASSSSAPVQAGSLGNSAPVAVAAAPTAAAAPAPAQISNSAGPVRPQAQAAADTVVAAVPGAAGITIGGTRASAVDPHGHPSGLALDYMVLSDAALGDAIAQYQIDHWDQLGVEYVIWQQRILTSPTGSWQPMEDRGNATANHRDHVHVNYRG